MKLSNLKTNSLREPIGYTFDFLSFSWLVEDVKGKSIEELEINIYSDENSSELVFKSGILKNHPKNLYAIDGNFLQPKTRYYWTISVKTEENETAFASSFFETGKMNEAWLGDWITYEGQPKESVVFAKTVRFEKKIKKGRLYCCGLGLYELYLNEQLVGEEKLLPGYHSYDKNIQYQTFDVTNLLQEESSFKFLIGNGWYKGRFVFEGGYEKIYGTKQKMIMELHVEYEDGEYDQVVSDLSWKCYDSYIEENSIYDGETIDFRKKYVDNLSEFKLMIDSKNVEDKNLLVARYNPLILSHETLKPIDAFYNKDGDVVLDFGQIMTGWLEGTFKLEKDKVVIIQFGELLQNGDFYRENLRTAKQALKIIGSGKEEIIRPHFTFFGFRYVKVSGLTLEEASRFHAPVIYSDIQAIGKIETSNNDINQLISNILWSQKGNFLDIPTDCPQRDERMGWTGDVTVFANASCYNMDTLAFYHHYLQNLCLEQIDLKGSVPFFVPYPKVEKHEGINPFLVTDGASTWADVATVLPLTLYKHFKNHRMLEHHLEVMKAWVDYVRKRDIEHGNGYLWDFDPQLGDWLALDNGNPHNPIGATDIQFVASVYYYISANNVAIATDILNDSQKEYYNELQKNIKAAFIYRYYNGDDITLPTITQTALSLVLKYKLYPTPAAREKLINQLKDELKRNDNYLNTGFVGTPAIVHALSENGATEVAYKLVLNEKIPSWLYAVKQGATTLWERWNSILPDGTISGTEMNSLNHYAYGSIGDWLFEVMAGIKQELTRVDEQVTFTVHPQLDRRIERVHGSLATINGQISVHWEWEDNKVNLSVSVPFNSIVELVLPNKEKVRLETGRYEYRGLEWE